MSRLILKSFFVVCFCTLLVQPATADIVDQSLIYRDSFNLQIITLGANYYWKANQVMPSSILELRDAGLLPLELINPVTEQPLNLNPDVLGPGEITFEKLDDQTLEVTWVLPSGEVMNNNLDSSLMSVNDTELDATNRRIGLYRSWAHISFQTFYIDKGFVPGCIDDLINTGYWPFEGQLNPVTGMPLQFDSSEPGDLHYTFGIMSSGYTAMAAVHFPDGSVGAASVSTEYHPDYFRE